MSRDASSVPLLSVVIPTHNPHQERLRRTLAGLRAQSLPASQWETLIIDNASRKLVSATAFPGDAPENVRVVVEPTLGLTHARRRGFREARGSFIVMVDDDNVLAPGDLQHVVALFATHPQIGAVGGRSVAEFERPPEPWWDAEFDSLIACRDLGDAPLLAKASGKYPLCAPIGAGMALRKAAADSWLAAAADGTLTDRRGTELTSGGDNDIVLTVLKAGWTVAYFPELALTHLIPAGRVEKNYLARLNRGIAKSWMQVLRKHGLNPWPPVASWTLPLRKGKAWFTYRAWRNPTQFIRWQGACGHFEGRVVT